MPFTSQKQRAACYATKGFGGKVDCKKWEKETPKTKLPVKVKKKK